jgi:hypothetical protein
MSNGVERPLHGSTSVIHAEERVTPKNRKKIGWKLITDQPVGTRGDAIEKLEWYALRWKIEVFHKILNEVDPMVRTTELARGS